VKCFLSRHHELRKYRVGTLEEGSARNGRLDVVASWFSILTLMYRDYRMTSPRQVWNMDETHVQARTSAMRGREGTLGGVGMVKPEDILPAFSSGAGACTAAFCVSAAGVVATHFIVVDGQTPGHAYVSETKADGSRTELALPSYLSEGAVVWRRSPPAFIKLSLTFGPQLSPSLRVPTSPTMTSFYPWTTSRRTFPQWGCLRF